MQQQTGVQVQQMFFQYSKSRCTSFKGLFSPWYQVGVQPSPHPCAKKAWSTSAQQHNECMTGPRSWGIYLRLEWKLAETVGSLSAPLAKTISKLHSECHVWANEKLCIQPNSRNRPACWERPIFLEKVEPHFKFRWWGKSRTLNWQKTN